MTLLALLQGGVPLCVPGSTLKPRIANASEMAIYQEAAKEANASEDILLVYLIELDGMR